MNYLKSAMTALKTTAVVGAAASVFSGSAEAQNRRPQQQAIQRQGTRTAPHAQRAVPRSGWERFAVDASSREFRLHVRYERGMPYFNNTWGFFYYSGPTRFWVPNWCFTGISYEGAVERELYNVSRFGPPTGAAKLARGYENYVYNAWGQMVPAEPAIKTGDQSPVNLGENQTVTYGDPEETRRLSGENEMLRRENAELREREAEHRGYERGLAEQRSQPAAQTTPQAPATEPPQHVAEPIPEQTITSRDLTEEKILVRQRYGGKIDKGQYDDEGIATLNGMFDAMRMLTNGDINLYPFDIGGERLEIRDGNDKFSRRGVIDMSRYANCMEPSSLQNLLFSDLTRAVDMSNYPGIVTRARAALDFQVARDRNGNVYTASTCK